jgi:gamma-glutamyl-gamma-aminobutyrate hydrolase PuuD
MASAYSVEDGLIEAIESPGHDWVVGVQWHNEIEEQVPKNFGNLFQSFVERAETYGQRKKASLH